MPARLLDVTKRLDRQRSIKKRNAKTIRRGAQLVLTNLQND